MPYAIEKLDENRYVVKKEDDGEIVGRTRSRAGAESMIRAIYANENK